MIQSYSSVPGLYFFPLDFNPHIRQGVHPNPEKLPNGCVELPEPGHVRVRSNPRWALDDTALPPFFSEEKDAVIARTLVYSYLVNVGSTFQWTLAYQGPAIHEPLPDGNWFAATAGRIVRDSHGQVGLKQANTTFEALVEEGLMNCFDVGGGVSAFGPTIKLVLRLVSGRKMYLNQDFHIQKMKALDPHLHP